MTLRYTSTILEILNIKMREKKFRINNSSCYYSYIKEANKPYNNSNLLL